MGYHVVSAFYSEATASEACSKLQEAYEKDMIGNLVNHCGHDPDAARKIAQTPLQYFIIETTIEDEQTN